MKFVYTLRDGNIIYGDSIYVQRSLTNVIQKRYTEDDNGNTKEYYNIVVLSDADIAYYTLTDLSKEEVYDYLDSVDEDMDKYFSVECNDCDKEVTPPVDLKLYN